jgi:hypothetical protein
MHCAWKYGGHQILNPGGERWASATLPNELLAHSPYSITPKDLKREILAEREEIHI